MICTISLGQYITRWWDTSNGCKSHMQILDMATNLTTDMKINIKGMIKLRQAPTPHSHAQTVKHLMTVTNYSWY